VEGVEKVPKSSAPVSLAQLWHVYSASLLTFDLKACVLRRSLVVYEQLAHLVAEEELETLAQHREPAKCQGVRHRIQSLDWEMLHSKALVPVQFPLARSQ
jgi:hypothetical protein